MLSISLPSNIFFLHFLRSVDSSCPPLLLSLKKKKNKVCRHEGVKKSEKKIDVLAVAAYDNNGTTLENKHKHLCNCHFAKNHLVLVH